MDEKKRFVLTRGKLILLVLLIIIIVILIVLFIPKNNMQKYSVENFERLEYRMEEEIPQYISQNNIVLAENEEKRITLDDLIDSQSILETEITNICNGYVIVKKVGAVEANAYISCGKYYITEGYIQSITTTTKKTTSLVDNEKPVIKLIGESTVTIKQNTAFMDPGVTAHDNLDGDITSDIEITGDINISVLGEYKLYYTVKDSSGNSAQIFRTIIVKSNAVTTTRIGTTRTTAKQTTKVQIQAPTIILKGSKQISLDQNEKYVEPGYTASDYYGNSLTNKVAVTGTVNTAVPGNYSKTYTVRDSYNNSTRTVRLIIVNAISTIKLKGINVQRNTITLSKGQQYQVIVYYTPSNATDKILTWSSSNNAVASVTSTGLIKGIGKGAAIITTKSNDGSYKAYTSVTVN